MHVDSYVWGGMILTHVLGCGLSLMCLVVVTHVFGLWFFFHIEKVSTLDQCVIYLLSFISLPC